MTESAPQAVQFRTESYGRKSKLSWLQVRDRIGEIERACFGAEAYTDDELRVDFNKRAHLSVFLWEDQMGEEYLVGYTQAELAKEPLTYYVANTAIDPAFQGRGLVKLLMDHLYRDIRATGAEFIERDAAIAGGYADNLVKIHAADVLETRDHDSQYGPQRYIRMRVPS